MRESKSKRILPSLLGLAVVAAVSAAVTADASVSIGLTLDEVARDSAIVARVVALDRTSARENGRIVTTTRARVERIVAGRETHDEVRIKTFGGVVGNDGERVEGEAAFATGRPSIVFLSHQGDAFVVTGRAQGQLAITRSERDEEIVRVGRLGVLVPRARQIPLAPIASSPVMTTFDGQNANDVAAQVARAWEKTHAN